ncbi:MAG: MFS transporter [Clostridia bacterium]|nr:MFS transporter [Clostridia bacterium]
MFTLLLAIIYLGFISLGLPDALFGASWPVLQPTLDVPLSFAGIVTMTISGGTIIASLFSDKLTSKFGAGLVTSVSVGMTATALLGFSFCTEFWHLILCAIPLGLGAGAVDAALNNFVALHFASKHMSWLHCFWGVGASISPYIMSFWLSKNEQWENGYRTVGFIQIFLTVILFISLPLWKQIKTNNFATDDEESPEPKKLREIFKIKGVKSVLFAFLAFCAVEATAFSWTSSFLVLGKDLSVDSAAKYASLFYLGMTVSRLITGFFADKLGDKKMIRLGFSIAIIGLIMMILPISNTLICLVGIFITGFGNGPIYPAIIHSTPQNFGKENSQAVVGVQMAFAYTGSSFMPPIFGLIANHISISLFPVFLLFFIILGSLLIENLNKIKKSVS